jgi:hypothetical protein
MEAILLFLREEAAPDTPDHAAQNGVNWTAAYILLPIIVIILVGGSIGWYKVRQRIRDRNRTPVDEDAQAQRAEDIADGYLRWLESLGQRASSIGIWHPADSDPAHLTAVREAENRRRCGEPAQDDNVGKFAVRLGLRKKPADKTTEEHELRPWDEPYIPAGERVMNIKEWGKPDQDNRAAEKKPVKINPGTGLPYGYSVRQVQKLVAGNPHKPTWIPQFVDPNGVVVVDKAEIRKLEAMAAGLHEPSSSYSSSHSPEPVMTSDIQDRDGYGYGHRGPSDEWPLAPRQIPANPFGSGAFGSKPHASSPLADVEEDDESPYSNSRSYGGSLGPTPKSRRWQELEQRTYGNIEMPEPTYSRARSNTSTAPASNLGTPIIGAQSRHRGQTTRSRARSDSRSEASSSRVEPKYKLNEHGQMRPNPAHSQSRAASSTTQGFERQVTRQHTFPPESPSSSSEGYPTSGTRYTTRPPGHTRSPAIASKTSVTDFGAATTPSPAAPQSLRTRSRAPTSTASNAPTSTPTPKPRTPARAPKYGLFPPVAYASPEQKEAHLKRQEILRNLYKEVDVPAGDKGKKKDDKDKDDKGKGKEPLWN